MQLQQSSERAAVWRTRALQGGGKLFAIPRATAGTSPAAVKELATVIGIVDRHDNILAERRRTAADAAERAEIVKWDRSNRSAHATIISDLMKNLAKARETTKAKRDRVLLPPPLTDGQTVLAIRENEIRQSMRSLTEEQKSRVMASLGRGEQPDVLLALARDPSPLSPLGDGARGLFKGFQQKAQAEALAAIDAEDEGHDVMETSLVAINNLISGA